MTTPVPTTPDEAKKSRLEYTLSPSLRVRCACRSGIPNGVEVVTVVTLDSKFQCYRQQISLHCKGDRT